MAIVESGKAFGKEIFTLSGRTVTWISTSSGIPLKPNQILSGSLIIILFAFWFVQGIEKKAIKIGLSIAIVWFIIGFFL